jgi:hypothetical protein
VKEGCAALHCTAMACTCLYKPISVAANGWQGGANICLFLCFAVLQLPVLASCFLQHCLIAEKLVCWICPLAVGVTLGLPLVPTWTSQSCQVCC